MSKYLLLLLPLLVGCTTTAERNVLNSLSAMGLVLDEQYKVVNITDSKNDGSEQRSFSAIISEKDAARIAIDLRAKDNIAPGTVEYDEAMNRFLSNVSGVSIVSRTTRGYMLDMNDAGSIYSKVHLDTIGNKIEYKYLSKLY